MKSRTAGRYWSECPSMTWRGRHSVRVDEGLYRALDTGHFPWLVQHDGWKVLRIYGQPLRCSFVFDAGG